MMEWRSFKALWHANGRITWHDALLYRWNVLFFLVFETMFFIGNFYGVSLGFDLSQGSLNGWSKADGLLLSAVFNFTHQVFLTFFCSFIFRIGDMCRDGSWDFILLKPKSPLWTTWASTEWLLANVPTTCLSLGVLVYLCATQGVFHNPLHMVMGIGCVLMGILVRFCLGLGCVALVFWSETFHGGDTYWNIVNLGLYPKGVYPKSLQAFITFGIPMAMISIIPAEALLGLASWEYVAAALGASMIFCWMAIKFFYYALSFYNSANAGV